MSESEGAYSKNDVCANGEDCWSKIHDYMKKFPLPLPSHADAPYGDKETDAELRQRLK